jgi:isocitrate dehydrogenase
MITYDLARQLPGAKQVATSVFAQAVVDAIHGAPR